MPPGRARKFQGFFIESGKDMLAAKPSIAELTKESQFLLRAQAPARAEPEVLSPVGNDRKEIIEATAGVSASACLPSTRKIPTWRHRQGLLHCGDGLGRDGGDGGDGGGSGRAVVVAAIAATAATA